MHTRNRPTTFLELVGNDAMKASIAELLSKPKEKWPHAFLFSGDNGTGKTTCARILAKVLGAQPLGIVEINASDHRKLEDARELLKEANTLNVFSTVQVFIIDEAQQFLASASQAILKLLEEPPAQVYFIICTTEPNKVLKGLRERCMHYILRPLSDADALLLLKQIKKKEQIKLTPTQADLIIERAQGIPRVLLTSLNLINGCETLAEARLLLDNQTNELKSDIVEIVRGILNVVDEATFQNLLRTHYDTLQNNTEGVRLLIGKYLSKVVISPSNVNIYVRFGEILALFSEPLIESGSYIKLLSNILKAYVIMQELHTRSSTNKG